jgi:hypothetical protein
MPGDPRPWNPLLWEAHVQKVLKKRYAQPAGSYQHIEATVHGDCGLEGYAVDGTAYQCYAAQNWASSEQLYEKQRNKITRDIGTFLAKETEIIKILGSVKVAFWNFVVPYWNNKELLKHARIKGEYVRKQKSKHVASAFRISILTEDDFAVEAQLLANLNLYHFDVPAPRVSHMELAKWMKGQTNLQLVSNLKRKATLIGESKSSEAQQKFEIRMIENYIASNIVLGQLEQELPETYGRILESKVAREANLEAESFSTIKVPAEFFENTLQEYRTELNQIPGLSRRVVDSLARGAVSDWLLQCPLDFE